MDAGTGRSEPTGREEVGQVRRRGGVAGGDPQFGPRGIGDLDGGRPLPRDRPQPVDQPRRRPVRIRFGGNEFRNRVGDAPRTDVALEGTPESNYIL